MENNTEIINNENIENIENLFDDDLFIKLINTDFEESIPIINSEINEIIQSYSPSSTFDKSVEYNNNLEYNLLNSSAEKRKNIFSQVNIMELEPVQKTQELIIPLSTDLINNNQNDLKKIAIKKGQKILNKNDFFNDLEFIMSNKIFSSFYKKYFTDFSNIRTIILYMKLYETIQKEYKEKHGYNIEKELLIYIIKELMSNSYSRKNVYDAFYKYCDNMNDNKKLSILDIFENRSIQSIKN